MITGKNYSGQTNPDVGDETEFTRCNFSHTDAVASGDDWVGHRLFPGDDTPREFTRCNLINCEVPPGSTMTKCNTTIRRTRVVTSTEIIDIDGEQITLEYLHNIIYGRQTAAGVYEYLGTPEWVEYLPEGGGG